MAPSRLDPVAGLASFFFSTAARRTCDQACDGPACVLSLCCFVHGIMDKSRTGNILGIFLEEHTKFDTVLNPDDPTWTHDAPRKLHSKYPVPN
jgi:hypothetical protein